MSDAQSWGWSEVCDDGKQPRLARRRKHYYVLEARRAIAISAFGRIVKIFATLQECPPVQDGLGAAGRLNALALELNSENVRGWRPERRKNH